MAEVLESRGIGDYLVSIDGEVRVKGSKFPGAAAWTIALETPLRYSQQVYDLIQPQDCSIATSGDYRNFVELNNKHYTHHIDPLTAQPIDNGVGSVTVSQSACMMADAWATALLAIGPDKGVEIAIKHNIPALFLLREYYWGDNGAEKRALREIQTPGFAAVIAG